MLAVTGAEQVDVIAFSQGGLVLRTALRLDGLAPDVATAVLIAPTFHGTTSPLIASLPAGACAGLRRPGGRVGPAGRARRRRTSADGDLDGDVRYAVVVQPRRHGRHPARRAGSASVRQTGSRRWSVQDRCPDEYVDHIALPANSGVIGWAVDALDYRRRDRIPTALTCG